MKISNKYLNQSNFFTRSLFKLDREIHKDIVYLIQSKINYFGTPQDNITISFDDYLDFKGVKRKDTYTFDEFHSLVREIKGVGGAFYNKINQQFVSFNIIDNIRMDLKNPERLVIKLAEFGKIFFFKEELENYIKTITPKGMPLKYSGHTQIENSVGKLRGIRRKKFFEIISQFKNTGYYKVSFRELKMYLGYIEIVDKETKEPIDHSEQLKMIFLPEDKYEFIDSCPRYSFFERDFLKGAIKSINEDDNKDINDLELFNKLKTGRSITHLEFRFKPLGRDLTEEEQKTVTFFQEVGLDTSQIIFLIKKIGTTEMLSRWMQNVDKQIIDNEAKHFDRKTNTEIKNMSGFLYKKIFTELGNS